jgi:L-alanine-DL-glutamate epimerase-like enolase superfamily enzyme
MKITALEAYPVKLGMREPFVIASAVNDDMFYVVIRLRTDEGLVGYGEAIPAWEVTGETPFSVIDAVHHLCDPSKCGFSLIGQEIGTLPEALEVLDRISPHAAISALAHAPSAKAALEQAILDALGKKLGKPVYELFGGENQAIPFNNVIGIFGVDETLQRVERLIADGARTIKLKVGLRRVGELDGRERDIAVIREARTLIHRTDPSVRLVADANQGYVTAEQAIAVIRRMEGQLDWLEQPCLAQDRLAFRRIKQACDIPLMADESVHGFHDAELLLEDHSVDFLNLKLMKTGGLMEALRTAELAARFGVPCQLGSMLESELGTAFGCHAFLSHPNIRSAELGAFRRLRRSLGSGLQVEGATVRVSNTPGCGITVDEDALRAHLITEGDSSTYALARRGFIHEHP